MHPAVEKATERTPTRPHEATPQQILARPVQYLKGVGPERAKILANLELFTARDLLFHFPRTYEDHSDVREVAELEPDKPQTVRGMVVDVDGRSSRFGRSIVGVLIKQGDDYLRGVWFNQPYWREKFRLGQYVMLSGKPRMNGGRWEIAHPRVTWLEDETDQPKSSLVPVYPLTQGIAQHQMRRLVASIVEDFAGVPDEVFSADLLERFQLLPIAEALRKIHAPANQDELQLARRRFVFQELLILQLGLAVRRWEQQAQVRAPALATSAKIDARILRLFPFEITAGQRRVIDEIAADMARERPMNRLLQGDVGSGKTVAALYAILLCVAHGCQAALMAPTEILAQQHAQTLGKVLQASRVRWALLSGGLSSSDRTALLERLASGQLDVVLGTHAVVQDDVEFARLGLVVIDEQHKFGVRQRARLRGQESGVRSQESGVRGQGSGVSSQSSVDRATDHGPRTTDDPSIPDRQSAIRNSPHYLVMTATPIPRTVTLAVFGDLDVSTLRDMPPGRKEVNTYLVHPDQQGKWWEFVRKQLSGGRQAYVITPLVEESAHYRAANVEATFEALANGELEAFRVGLVHGRMTPHEKQAAMEEFRAGRRQVLVATSVIEVGVDVPNATIMTILSPERFGLAQLHQLRGRICRGTAPGFCGVFLDPPEPEPNEDDFVGSATDEQATRPEAAGGEAWEPSERLQAFAKTTDGFELAEVDFRLRGPGDIFGVKQHGLPPLRIADLVRDAEVVEEARREAQTLVAADPGLREPAHQLLRRMVLSRYGEVLDLGDVG
jgi:ATP-dependent DNA helicase RecG